MTSHLSMPAEGVSAPEDDGAAKHLHGLRLPPVDLASTDGSTVTLSALTGCVVIYVYPMTGRPDLALPKGWDEIPGARGCTPQACSFRDHHAELRALHADVYGLSAQDSEYQREVRDRLHLPFQLLSDCDLMLAKALRVPTFEVGPMQLFKRLTIIARGARIEKIFYPVFPPDRNADDVLDWLRSSI